jgi:hypothetical protein
MDEGSTVDEKIGISLPICLFIRLFERVTNVNE